MNDGERWTKAIMDGTPIPTDLGTEETEIAPNNSNIRVFMDGNAFCATHLDFVNLQESPAGFGDTREEAIANLQKDITNA